MLKSIRESIDGWNKKDLEGVLRKGDMINDKG